MSLPAAIALRRSLARSLVVAASKNSVSSRFLSAALRSLVQRVSPCAFAKWASLALLRPTRIGSGITRSPFLSARPPCARMARIERIKCWFMPMRPVTPFMMMPSRCCAISVLPFIPAVLPTVLDQHPLHYTKSIRSVRMTVVPAKAGTHNHRLWNMGPQHKRVYARLRRANARGRRQKFEAQANQADLSLLHSQQPVDAPGILSERLVGLHLERARMRQLDAEIVGHARRAGGEHDHAGAEKHRLGDAVGDEDDGLLRLLPDAQQLKVHLLARERVERAERLVHQDELGIVNERARDRRALLHAAGELVGVSVFLALEAHEREEVAGASAACGHGQTEDFGGQQHVVDHAPPFEQQRRLKHHADVARGIERLRRRADLELAGVERVEACEKLEQRGLAAAGGPDQRHELARLHVERRLGDGEKIRSPRAVDLLHGGEVDERFAHGRPTARTPHASRASRTTSMRSSASTMP